jgi:thymidylate kinase
MKIITISGLDGSGKSTQTEFLKTYLEQQGKKVFYFHAIQFGIANKISNFSSYREKEDSPKSNVKSGKIGILLRKLFLRIDIHRFNQLIDKLEKEGFTHIISDRYFYDSIINIEYLSLPKIESSEFRKLNLRKPDVAIYLQTDPEIIMQRQRTPDQGIEYLREKKRLYDSAIYVWKLKVIDGNKNKEEIFEEIKKALSS